MTDVVNGDVAVLVLDSRGSERDRRDRRALGRALGEHGERITYVHRGSRDEPLLALPDGIGWAHGAGRDWRRIIAGVVELREVGEGG